MKRRMHRLLNEDGRILIVAMDHTSFMDSTVEGLARYGETCRSVVPAGADAFLSPIGSIIKYAEAIGPAAAIAEKCCGNNMLEGVGAKSTSSRRNSAGVGWESSRRSRRARNDP